MIYHQILLLIGSKKNPPLSGFGKIVLGQAYLLKNDSVKGNKLIKEGLVKLATLHEYLEKELQAL